MGETQWSKSTISRQLAETEERGQIQRIRVGREKIVLLSSYGIDGPPAFVDQSDRSSSEGQQEEYVASE